MSNDICVRRLTKELRSLQKDPITSPIINVAPNESNILEMHYVIEGGKNTPYENGIYHGKLIFPRDYPLKPPSVMMLTPSGRFQTNRRLCLSMSDFHPETWNPMWSVSTILTGLYSFMIETSPTLGSIETTTRQKRQFARQSLYYNVHDPMFCKLFPQYKERFDELKAAKTKLDQQKKQAMGLNNSSASAITSADNAAAAAAAGMYPRNKNNTGIQGILATTAGIIAIFSIYFAMRFF